MFPRNNSQNNQLKSSHYYIRRGWTLFALCALCVAVAVIAIPSKSGTSAAAPKHLAAQNASANQVIKLATLVPADSPWAQVIKVWAKAVQQRTNGTLELDAEWNGMTGDEDAFIEKMKSGDLDAALVTSTGLGKVYHPILALEIPGLFTNWSKLDSARNAMQEEFEQGAQSAGFHILGWIDVGMGHPMSTDQ